MALGECVLGTSTLLLPTPPHFPLGTPTPLPGAHSRRWGKRALGCREAEGEGIGTRPLAGPPNSPLTGVRAPRSGRG